MRNIHIVIGTRPDAIKMAPVYKALKKKTDLKVKLISTGQHKELLHQVYDSFDLIPDVDFKLMKAGMGLSRLTTELLNSFEELYAQELPDLVLGHGDTTTCYSTALSAFYHNIPFFHVEAGLRTYRLDSPFPEEFNRQSIAQLAGHHFAPTQKEKMNLLKDGVLEKAITITGGTIHGAMSEMTQLHSPEADIHQDKKLVVFTLHRREHKHQLHEMMNAIKRAAQKRSDVVFISPLHPNPVVTEAARAIFGGLENVILTDALRYPDFLQLLNRSDLILTDSGGVQEEAAYLGKRTLLLREETERQDGIHQGMTHLIGNKPLDIENQILKYLSLETALLLHPEMTVTKGASQIVADTVYERCLA